MVLARHARHLAAKTGLELRAPHIGDTSSQAAWMSHSQLLGASWVLQLTIRPLFRRQSRSHPRPRHTHRLTDVDDLLSMTGAMLTDDTGRYVLHTQSTSSQEFDLTTSLRSCLVRHSVTFLRQLERARQQGMRVSQIGEEDEDSVERRRRRRERKAAKKAAAAAAAATTTDARGAIDADRGHGGANEAPPVHNGVHKRKRDKDGEVPGVHKAKKHKHKEKDKDKDRRKQKHRD